MSPALGSGRRGLSDSYRLKTCGVPQSTYAGATGITSYLSSVDPGGAGPQRCGVADPSRRRGGNAVPPRHLVLIAVRGARGTLRAANLGSIYSWSDGFPQIRRSWTTIYGGRRLTTSARLRRPVRLLRIGRSVVASLSLSAASFCDITSSQKETTASHDPSLPTILRTMVGSERSPPISATRVRRGPSHATHSSTTCRAVSSWHPTQWWHLASGSLPMRHRYRPKQPWPVRICVARNVREPCRLPSHSTSTGRIASTVLIPAVGRSSLAPHSATRT